MDDPQMPVWPRVILLVLDLLSFCPQLHRIHRSRSASGISLWYILFNLVNATEQFAMFFLALVNEGKTDNIFARYPHSAGDWLNFSHTGLNWLLFITLFILAVRFSENHRRWPVAAYAFFFLTSLLPLFIGAAQQEHSSDAQALEWFVAFYFAIHTFIIYPIVTILVIVAVFLQARKIRTTQLPSVLSLPGLLVQALTFSLVGVSWIWRVPYGTRKVSPDFFSFMLWYQTHGFLTVNDLLFAVGQAVLLVFAVRKARAKETRVPQQEGERAPLLQNEEHGGYMS